MNNKGFTIVELLAVIAIIAIISSIAIPSAFTLSNRVKKNMYCEKVNMIVNEAKRWGTDHINSLKSTCYTEKKVVDFVNAGLIKKESNVSGKYITNPYNDTYMDNMSVYIFVKNKQAYAYYNETNNELKTLCEQNTTLPSNKC